MRSALALVVCAVIGSSVPADARALATGSSRTYRDDVGEVVCCTRDISAVTVSNDDAGRIHFSVRTFADAEELKDDDDLEIRIDTDGDLMTGGEGAEYRLAADVSTSVAESDPLTRWNERLADFVDVPHADVLSSAKGNVFRFTLDRHLLGDIDEFRFMVALYEVTSYGGFSQELAPSVGMWDYSVQIAIGRLRPVLAGSGGHAGGTFTQRLGLRVVGTRALLGSGRITCHAFLAGMRLVILSRGFVDRRAVCRWGVPRTAPGTTLRGMIGVYVTEKRTSLVSRTFTHRIRLHG